MRMRASVRPSVGAVTDVMRRAAAEAVVEVAEDVLNEANDLVPVDQGDLRRSGEVVADADQGIAAVTYDTPYAVRQHEDPTLQHPRGGEAGFLRKAVEQNEQRYFQHIADAIRDAAS